MPIAQDHCGIENNYYIYNNIKNTVKTTQD